MAEGFAKAFKGDKYHFYSAGTKKGSLNPRAAKAMAEVGIDITKQRSKTIAELPQINFDFVVTVCSDANENCPYLPGVKIVHVGFDDPPRLTQELIDEDEILNVYRRVRDQIKTMVNNIEDYLEQ